MSTTLITIGGVGFMFEVSHTLKHNLISPDVFAFFDRVKESGEVTEDCAFPTSIPLTNQRHSIFHNVGEDWIVCHDDVFRKCPKVECEVRQEDTAYIATFYIDRSLKRIEVLGVISGHETE